MLIMLGDNVYGDDHSGELTKLKFAYEKQKDNNAIHNYCSNINNFFTAYPHH